MLLTVFLSADTDMGMWRGAVLFGAGILMGFSLAIALSMQHWLGRYLLGALLFLLSVVLVHSLLRSYLAVTQWHSYVIALGISWLPLYIWVLYRALCYEDVSQTVAQKRAIAAAKAAATYVEHSPVYDDDFQPRFE